MLIIPRMKKIGLNTGTSPRYCLISDIYAIVDDEDFDRVVTHRWTIQKAGHSNYHVIYARDHSINKLVRLHRFIMGDPPEPGLVIDHRDGNPLLNTRSNLRWVTQRRDCQNRVPRDIELRGGKWHAYIGVGAHRLCVGSFDCPKDAKIAYHAALASAGMNPKAGAEARYFGRPKFGIVKQRILQSCQELGQFSVQEAYQRVESKWPGHYTLASVRTQICRFADEGLFEIVVKGIGHTVGIYRIPS